MLESFIFFFIIRNLLDADKFEEHCTSTCTPDSSPLDQFAWRLTLRSNVSKERLRERKPNNNLKERVHNFHKVEEREGLTDLQNLHPVTVLTFPASLQCLHH